MASIPFMPIQQHVISKLKNNLPPQLTYHCLAHTLDVLAQAQKIATAEGITDPNELLILKVAALYHDMGFILSYHDHEAQGCEIVKQELPEFGFSPAQVKKVCGLIIATKIPQCPQNQLEQIICDADLDYLGRDDFSKIANNLYLELKNYNKLTEEDEWNVLQVKFLEKHTYFTRYAQQNREAVKQAHLQTLRATVSQVQ